MEKVLGDWLLTSVCDDAWTKQENAKKTHRRCFVLFACAFIVVLSGICPSGTFAVECDGGHWELVETIQDQWGYPDPQNTFKTYGITMGFWEQPTSCTDVVYEGESKLEYVKSLVCVSSSLTKIQEAPAGPNCVIEGKAIPATGPYAWPTTNPCVVGVYMGGGGYTSNYGDVTIAKSMKKYKRVCPDIGISESNNPDPGKPDCPQLPLN